MRKLIQNLLLFAAILTLAACASENNNATQNGNCNTNAMTEFAMIEESPQSRTAGEYTGTKLKFYWTAQDRLWLNNGTTVQRSSRDNLAEQLVGGVTKVPTARFWFDGSFTNPTYPLRYTGKNGTKDKVTIAATQTQTLPTDASHIGESGDCGTATATKNGDHYDFTLTHKAAYFTLVPFTTDAALVGGKLTKIKITANKPIAGTFDFDDSGLNTTNAPTSPSNSITLNLKGADNNGFTLAAAASVSDNSATIVLPPGTYSTFDIEYTVTNPVTNETGITTTNHTNITFTEGKNKKLSPDLTGVAVPIQYLFHDGTTAMLADAAGRQPIGLVIKGNGGVPGNGLAIALTNVRPDIFHSAVGPAWDAKAGYISNEQSNAQFVPNYNDALQDMKGYLWTWDPAYSFGGIGVKVDKKFKRTPTSPEEYRYPAFYYAGHYGDEIAGKGITVTGPMVGRKWHLPSMGEWYLFARKFMKPGSQPQTQWDTGGFDIDIAAADNAFIAAGGTGLEAGINYYWCSTELNLACAASATILYSGPNAAILRFDSDLVKEYLNGPARAFIRF